MPWSQELQKYPGLLPELGQFLAKLQQNVQPPIPRNASRLLPLLPESTVGYLAFPNYGDVAHQTLATFRQELQESAVLRDWWTHGRPAADGPKVEQFLDNFAQLNEYLGDEIVVSGAMDAEGKDVKVLAIAGLRKPGLDKFLQGWIAQAAETERPGIRVLTPQQLDLPLSGRPGATQGLLILVRSDLVVATSDLATLRSFNARLNAMNREFTATPFGERVAQEYRGGGVVMLGAVDIHQLLQQIPIGTKDSPVTPKDTQQTFERSGFADMKYVVWKQAMIGRQSASQAELSFTGPRHGAAAWLAKPTQLGSLDFVSPKAMFAFTAALASPSQIFDDIKGFSDPSKGNVFAALEGGQKALNLNLKDDLLSLLSGELTVEVDALSAQQPDARLIFKVNDVAHLHRTLTTLLSAAQLPTQHVDERECAYDVVRIPRQGGSMPVAYAFVDGYLVIGSKPETLIDALRMHRSGESLAKSQKFVASLPAGQPPEASALFYHDPAATAALPWRQISPELADVFGSLAAKAPPSVTWVYGEETAIREQSNSGSFDVGPALVVAAVAVPNLVRSRVAANEGSAVASMRTLSTAQVTYAATYPKKGFAPNMAALGSNFAGPTKYSEDHAGLLDRSLANETCTGNVWCSKSGYDFRITTGCGKLEPCKEYLAIATPVDRSAGARSFCSTSDGIIRYRVGVTTATPVTVSQCRSWPPLQ